MKPVSKTAIDSDNSAMKTLALPADLYWDCKTEPISPLSVELLSMTEPAAFWLNDDDLENGITMVCDEDFDLKPGMELINGEDVVFEFDLKEEWPVNKLPLLDNDSAIAHPNPVTKVPNTFAIDALKSENFEIAVLTTLTPPQSPPLASTTANILPNAVTESSIKFSNVLQQPATATVNHVSSIPLATTQQQLHAVSPTPAAAPTAALHFAPYYGTAPFTPSEAALQTDDDKRNSQMVDEFLQSCIQDLPNLNDECDTISWSSYSESASRPDSIETDEDWSPNSSFTTSSASCSPMHNDDEDNTQQSLVGKPETKKRTRPYGRGIEDRKIRKKEQNKNAATRYRQKKKVEMECVLNEEQQLTLRYDELKRILAERKREAKYLKTLIKEFYRKKNRQ